MRESTSFVGSVMIFKLGYIIIGTQGNVKRYAEMDCFLDFWSVMTETLQIMMAATKTAK